MELTRLEKSENQFMKQLHSSQYGDCLPPKSFQDATDKWTDCERKDIADFFMKLFMEEVEAYGGLILLPPDCEVFNS